MTERNVSSERVSALLPVDGLEVVAWEHKLTGIIRQRGDKPSLGVSDGDYEELCRLSQASSVIAGLTPYKEELEKIADDLREPDDPFAVWESIVALNSRISSLEEENKRLSEALTPSGDTKAAYAGELFERVEIVNPMFEGNEDDEPETIMQSVPVSWTTIKEIMAAIRAYTQTEDHNG